MIMNSKTIEVGISLLITPRKWYDKVIFETVSEITEVQIRDELCGFGGGFVDQLFPLKCVCDKYLEKQKDVFVTFGDISICV
jgi:hypothetical protein